MSDPDPRRLLHGPYRAPALRRGDRAFCLLRDCEVVVTGWSGARIPWPRCRRLEGTRGGGSGLPVRRAGRAAMGGRGGRVGADA